MQSRKWIRINPNECDQLLYIYIRYMGVCVCVSAISQVHAKIKSNLSRFALYRIIGLEKSGVFSELKKKKPETESWREISEKSGEGIKGESAIARWIRALKIRWMFGFYVNPIYYIEHRFWVQLEKNEN